MIVTVSAVGNEGPKQEVLGMDERGGCQGHCKDGSARCWRQMPRRGQEEGDCKGKATSPDLSGFVMGKNKVANFMAR